MFRADDPAERAAGLLRNVTYARLAMRDALLRGYAPYASHLILPQPLILDDDVPAERALGIDAGLAWGAMAEVTLAYVDLGVSGSMRYGLENAARAERPVFKLRLAGWESALSESPAETLARTGSYGVPALARALSEGMGVFGPVPSDPGFAASASSPR